MVGTVAGNSVTVVSSTVCRPEGGHPLTSNSHELPPVSVRGTIVTYSAVECTSCSFSAGIAIVFAVTVTSVPVISLPFDNT